MRKVWKIVRPFLKCFKAPNSPLLSRVVTFPDVSKIDGQRLCLWLAHSYYCCCWFRYFFSCGPTTDADAVPQFWKNLEKWPQSKVQFWCLKQKWTKLFPYLPHLYKIHILQNNWSKTTNPALSSCSKKTLSRIGGHHPVLSVSTIPTETRVRQFTR